MKYTGVFATREETKKCSAAADHAARTPVIALSSKHALKEGGFPGQAWKSARELCHKAALAHGLPEIEGYYGMTHDGEFVSA